jgi:hypothetical protein
MISGALEIMYGVDAALVHPLLLPASLGEEQVGYIVITHEDSPDVFDILFIRGAHVVQYAGFHHDLRTLMSEESVRMGIADSGMRCRVYLFSVSRQGFDRFLRTFHCVPSVNVVIDRLSRKQLSSLLTGIGCKNGILEIDRPSRPFPLIDLSRFHSVEELLREAFRFRQGRMIVYDLELNALIRRRAEILIGGPLPGDGESPDVNSADKAAGETEGIEPVSPEEGGGRPDPGTTAGEVLHDDGDASGLVAAFTDALKKFREAVVELYGDRLDKRMNHVLSRFFPSPDAFSPGMITPLNAPHVLEVIEECVKRAWLYRRKKLKSRALEIVRNLYDTHNELLLKHGVDRSVQETFRHLEE